MTSAPPPPAACQPAADVARRVATELRNLRTLVSRIERSVGALLVARSSVTPGMHRDLQSLDLLGQTLDGLAQYVDAAATQMPAGWQIDPARASLKLDLHDLASRLGSSPSRVPESGLSKNDDCQFF